MLNEFRAFVMKGNVLDLAVGVIIGAAFGKIVSSLTDDVIMPVIGWMTGGVDFSSKFITLAAPAAGYTGSLSDYTAMKAAGAVLIGYGSFITAIINFLILAFIIFMIIRWANRMMPKPADAPAGPSETDLLVEIRDELRKR